MAIFTSSKTKDQISKIKKRTETSDFPENPKNNFKKGYYLQNDRMNSLGKFQDLVSCEKSIKLRFLEKMSVENENFILREKKKFDEKSIEQIWTNGIIKDEFSAFQPILQLKPKVFIFHAISIAIMFNLNMFLAIIAPIFVFALGRLIIKKFFCPIETVQYEIYAYF